MSPPVNRVAALALLFAICWASVAMLLDPLARAVYEEHEEAENASIRLARYQYLRAGLPDLKKRRDELKAAVSGKAFIQSKSPALMTADAQSNAQKIAFAAGATIRSSRTLPVVPEDGYDRVGIELEIAASTVARRAYRRDRRSTNSA